MEIDVNLYKFVARPGFMVREIAGENTLIPIDTDNVYLNDKEKLPVFNGVIQMNDFALFLWNQLQESKSIDELIQLVSNEFDVSQTTNESIKEDILDFLKTGIVNQIIFLTEKEGR